jgi:hypothetical protein
MKTSDQSSRAWVFLLGALVLGACSGGGGATSVGGGPSGANSGSVAAPGAATSAEASAPAAASAPAGGGTGGGAIGGSVTDAGHLADLLGPGDFAAVGVSGAGTPTVNAPESGSAFIVYAGKSGGTGGIELDAVAGVSADGMADVFASMSAPFLDFEGRGKADLPQADEAMLRADNPIDGGGEWAGIAVRKGRLVFLIAIPASDAAESQLVSLARLVLDRGSALE